MASAVQHACRALTVRAHHATCRRPWASLPPQSPERRDSLRHLALSADFSARERLLASRGGVPCARARESPRHSAGRWRCPAARAEKGQEVSEAARKEGGNEERAAAAQPARDGAPVLEKELSKAVRKTAATFAPRPSTRTSNPAVPGSTLYRVFEVQGYMMAVVGGLLAFNVLFPSDGPDIWRLMGMWSIWMFTIPSLRARDCSAQEKEALNYLFLLIPLLNVGIPVVYKSFGAVWAADVAAFAALYAWKLGWLSSGPEDA